MKHFLLLLISSFTLIDACLVQYIDPYKNQTKKEKITATSYTFNVKTLNQELPREDNRQNFLDLLSQNNIMSEEINILSSFRFSDPKKREEYFNMIFKGFHYLRLTNQLFLPGIEATIIAHFKASLKTNPAESKSKQRVLESKQHLSWPQQNIKLFSCLLGLSSCAATLGVQWVYKIWKHKKLFA